MDIHNAIDRPTRKGPADYFTGTAWLDPIIEAPEPARVRALRVSFEPGARTAWPTHPLGQTLHVPSGIGRVQAKGAPARQARPGATGGIPPATTPSPRSPPNTNPGLSSRRDMASPRRPRLSSSRRMR